MKITLKFLGMDSWGRPVYEDETGTLWKDVNPCRQSEPELRAAYGNNFDGEPDVLMSGMKRYADAEAQFLPERIVWTWG